MSSWCIKGLVSGKGDSRPVDGCGVAINGGDRKLRFQRRQRKNMATKRIKAPRSPPTILPAMRAEFVDGLLTFGVADADDADASVVVSDDADLDAMVSAEHEDQV